MANRTRPKQIVIRVSEEERAQIKEYFFQEDKKRCIRHLITKEIGEIHRTIKLKYDELSKIMLTNFSFPISMLPFFVRREKTYKLQKEIDIYNNILQDLKDIEEILRLENYKEFDKNQEWLINAILDLNKSDYGNILRKFFPRIWRRIYHNKLDEIYNHYLYRNELSKLIPDSQRAFESYI